MIWFYLMPGMTGFEFIIKVREMQPNVKVLLMSAFEINDSGFSKALPPNTKINVMFKSLFRQRN
jgi:CheY-like chemotaxis protein